MGLIPSCSPGPTPKTQLSTRVGAYHFILHSPSYYVHTLSCYSRPKYNRKYHQLPYSKALFSSLCPNPDIISSELDVTRDTRLDDLQLSNQLLPHFLLQSHSLLPKDEWTWPRNISVMASTFALRGSTYSTT